MAKLRYISLFSGIEAWSCAVAGMPEYEAVAFSEIDPFACAVLKHHYPGVKNYGDVTKIDGKALRGKVDLIVGGSPCFVAGTPVLTPSGYRPIEELAVGDEVVSADGNVCRISATGHKTASVGRLKILGRPEITCTPNHPFLCFPIKTSYKNNKARYVPAAEPSFVEAEKTEKLYACRGKWSPAPMPELPSLPGLSAPEDVLELAGWYVGDGFLRGWKSKKTKATVLGLVREEKISAFMKRFPDLRYTITNIGHVHIYGTSLANWLLENFGQHSSEKRIPYWLYCSPLKKCFLDGYRATDGYEKNGRSIICSTSKALVYGVADLAGGSTVCNAAPEMDRPIKGVLAHHSAEYVVSIPVDAKPTARFFFDRWSSRVRSWTPIEDLQAVYNIAVEEDHTYVAAGVAVHNCQGFSVAGLRKGLDDERSCLALAYVRLLDEIRPAWFVFENVPGLLSCNGGNDFKAFLKAVAECGYNCSWQVLNSMYHGVAQRRRRVFVVGYLGDWTRPAKVFFEPSCLSRNPPPRRKAGQGDPRGAEAGAGNGRLAGTLCASGAGLDRPSASGNQLDYCVVDEVAGPLTASYAKQIASTIEGQLVAQTEAVATVERERES